MLSWDECYPLIVVNKIIYVFCEKLGHLENKELLKTTSLSFMIIGYLKEANYDAWNWILVYFKNLLSSMTIDSLKIFKTFKTHCCQQH